MKLICGDLNDGRPPARSAWLGRCLSATGIWRGYRSPYPPGDPTNLVAVPGGRSARELDWVLVSADTPCVDCAKVLLPGLSSHLAVVCDLRVPEAALRVRDPTGRQFRFDVAGAPCLRAAGVMVGLLLWWAASARLDPDATVLLCWAGMRPAIPVARRRLVADSLSGTPDPDLQAEARRRALAPSSGALGCTHPACPPGSFSLSSFPLLSSSVSARVLAPPRPPRVPTAPPRRGLRCSLVAAACR